MKSDGPFLEEENDVLILKVLADWQRDHGTERLIDTERVGKSLLAELKRRGAPYFMYLSAPWFGLERDVRRLQRAGLVEVDVGMAQFGSRTAPAHTIERYWLKITSAGETLLQERGWPG